MPHPLKASLIASAPLALLLGYAVLADLLFAWTVTPGVVAVPLVLGALLGLPVALALPSDLAFAPLAVYALCCCLLPAVELSPVKPFRLLYEDIQPGATAPEIFEARVQRFPHDGRWPSPRIERPDPDHVVLRLDPNDGRYNAEIILIALEDGRVASAEYHGD